MTKNTILTEPSTPGPSPARRLLRPHPHRHHHPAGHLRRPARLGLVVPPLLIRRARHHLFLSYATAPTVVPDPFFRIYTHRIHKAKHGSDSMSYDNEGRFRPQQFEDFFAKYDRLGKGGLSVRELWDAWRGQALLGDVFGGSAAFLECESFFGLFRGLFGFFFVRVCLRDGSLIVGGGRARYLPSYLAGRWDSPEGGC